MSVLRSTRCRWTKALAALLLVLQGLAGGVVPLAHASERFSAPAHIEAQHASACIVLHDELRCALCHYAGLRVLPQQIRVQPAATAPALRRPDRADVTPTAGAKHPTASPRAPPAPAS